MSQREPYRVWRFWESPMELRLLTSSDGYQDDCDWLGIVPSGYDVPRWMEVPAFGCCSTEEFPQPDGSVIVLGFHA